MMLTFIETRLFSRLVSRYLSEDDCTALQAALMANPLLGDLIQRSGGVRKVRWARSGHGKRGGLRVIYYPRVRQGQIWMLTVYGKTTVDSIPASVLRKIREEIDGSR